MQPPQGRRPDPGLSSLDERPRESVGNESELRAARIRRLAAAGAAVGAVLALALLFIGPIAKSVARGRARDLGLGIEVQSTSVGFFFVRFRGVSLSAPEMPGISATLDRID